MPRHEPITAGTGKCSKCRLEKPATEFFTILKRGRLQLFRYCKLCNSIKNVSTRKKAKETNPEALKKKTREYHLRNQYKLTDEQFKQMMSAQESKCKILGMFEHDIILLDRAINYLINN